MSWSVSASTIGGYADQSRAPEVAGPPPVPVPVGPAPPEPFELLMPAIPPAPEPFELLMPAVPPPPPPLLGPEPVSAPGEASNITARPTPSLGEELLQPEKRARTRATERRG